MPLNEATLRRIEDWKAIAFEFAPLLMEEAVDPAVVADLRKRYNDFLARDPAPEGVRFSEVDMGGVRGVLATPEGAKDNRTLLYLHGGGYFSGGPDGYHGIVGHYAKMLGARVYMPDYRLAPEHRFPAPLDDSLTAYQWLVDTVGDARHIAISGDSAGGAMTVSLMVRAKRASIPLPAGGVAISPWCNLEMNNPSYRTRDGIDPLCTRDILVLMARAALGSIRPNDPDASPVYADVRGLPPLLIQIGESEVMLDDSIQLANHLAQNGVRTSLEVWPGMFHVWPVFSSIVPEGRQALENGCAFLDRLF
ncbi:esterase [Sphingobium sp. LB126]|uniref:alpha/beta hydrolase n=1 Tax=Sphingobium sp. LB126 TaxID=1983755 RepID=UPI000C20EE4C|nr:alpha/beta hydrolase [Sphingobium sp. LB126]PJG46505.1 esterase [Sphingobium sp. LB126]